MTSQTLKFKDLPTTQKSLYLENKTFFLQTKKSFDILNGYNIKKKTVFFVQAIFIKSPSVLIGYSYLIRFIWPGKEILYMYVWTLIC